MCVTYRSYLFLRFIFSCFVAVRMPRTQGTYIDDNTFLRLLSQHVPLASCRPRTLWAVEKISKNGTTSNWEAMNKQYYLLSDLLDHTDGHPLKQKRFHNAFREFLQQNGINWALVDSERSTYHLRVQMRTLQACKRYGRKPPQKFQRLQALVEKCALTAETSVDEDIDHDAKPPADVDMPLVLAQPVEMVLSSQESSEDCHDFAPIEEDSDDSLEVALFGRSSTPARVSQLAVTDDDHSATPLVVDYAGIDALVKDFSDAHGSFTVGPTPTEYRAMPKNRACSAARLEVKKRPAKKSATPLASSQADPVLRYVSIRDVAEKVLVKRVHSAVWHKERQALLAQGADDKEAKQKAAVAATSATLRFRDLRRADA